MRGIWVERGDTFFTRSQSLLGKLIRKEETELDADRPAWTNHTGVVVQSGWIGPDNQIGEGGPAVVVEALWHVRKGPLKVNGVQVRVFRPRPRYTGDELIRFNEAADEAVGQDYGWWKLPLIMLKRFTGIPFEKLFFIKTRPICSTLAGGVNETARRRGTKVYHPGFGAVVPDWPGFDDDPMELTPDTMMDYALAHPEYWEEVK